MGTNEPSIVVQAAPLTENGTRNEARTKKNHDDAMTPVYTPLRA